MFEFLKLFNHKIMGVAFKLRKCSNHIKSNQLNMISCSRFKVRIRFR